MVCIHYRWKPWDWEQKDWGRSDYSYNTFSDPLGKDVLSVSTPGSVGLYVLFLEWKAYTTGQSEGFTKPKVTLTISSHLNLLMLVDHKVKKGITIITEVFDYHEEILVLLYNEENLSETPGIHWGCLLVINAQWKPCSFNNWAWQQSKMGGFKISEMRFWVISLAV